MSGTTYNPDGTVASHAEGSVLTQHVRSTSGQALLESAGPSGSPSQITRQTQYTCLPIKTRR